MPIAKSRQHPLTYSACLTVLLIFASACGDATSPPPERGGNPMPPDTTTRDALTDAAIRGLAEMDSTWTWWELSDSLLDRAGNSPHADRIRVRYNAFAATQATGDPNAGHGSWLWPEYGSDDQMVHSVAADGATCHDCHVTGEDHMRMNDAH